MINTKLLLATALSAVTALAACDVAVVDRSTLRTSQTVQQQTPPTRQSGDPQIVKPDLTVTWASDFGAIDFGAGFYDDNSKTISGRLYWANNEWVYEGKWTVNGRGDRLRFVFSPDGQTFAGVYFRRDTTGTFYWNGRRQPGLRIADANNDDRFAATSNRGTPTRTTSRPADRTGYGRCANAAQGNIAWNGKGDTNWDDNQLQGLCSEAPDSLEPVNCFVWVMDRGALPNNRGGRWNWDEAVEVCRGTTDRQAQIGCVRTRLRQGENVWAAAANCRSSGVPHTRTTTAPRETPNSRLPADWREVNQFRHPNGRFIYTRAGGWFEYSGSKHIVYRFADTGKLEGKFFLFDESRKIELILDLNDNWIYYKGPGDAGYRKQYPVVGAEICAFNDSDAHSPWDGREIGCTTPTSGQVARNTSSNTPPRTTLSRKTLPHETPARKTLSETPARETPTLVSSRSDAPFEFLDEVAQPGRIMTMSPKPHAWVVRATRDWMAKLPDAMSLAKISIPGTHDSGMKGLEPYCDTQSMDIPDQLAAGIRYLDIRVRPMWNGFAIYHGGCPAGITFDDVLNDIRAFLRDHPGETILMRLKQADTDPESNAEDFTTIWRRYHSNFSDLFTGPLDGIPTLGEMRGKILVFENSGGKLAGFAWGSHMNIQDYYKINPLPASDIFPLPIVGDSLDQSLEDIEVVSIDRKKREVVNFLKQAGRSDILVLNHLSGTIMPPQAVAGFTHAVAFNEIGPYSGPRRLGVIIMDFPGEQLIYRIVKHNFSSSSNIRCRGRTFSTKSEHSWAEFRLPNSKLGTQIEIAGGAYNNYVFPKCNRVTWTDLRFTCSGNGTWSHTGSWDADALCHDSNTSQRYLAVGNR